MLWQLKSPGSRLVRCELEPLPDGQYRLRVLKGGNPEPVLEHDYPDRVAATDHSVIVYRGLKGNGFHDAPRAV